MTIQNVSGALGALQSAELGIKRGLEGIERNAQTVANASVEPAKTEDVTNALVDSLQQRNAVTANARMLSAADLTLGTLLNVKA